MNYEMTVNKISIILHYDLCTVQISEVIKFSRRFYPNIYNGFVQVHFLEDFLMG